MTETRKLLARYAEDGSESAFRELVESYIDLVYSTALRLVEGDSHRAEDVTQMVFVRLTQKARTLPGDVSLGGWLHRDTCHVAATLMRSERRRQVRERQAVEMNALDDDTHLDSVLPVLDDAINQLPDQDREAIILRFFEQQNFRALAAVVGGSEDAARMRVSRALDKLHGLLKGRGVALSLTGLVTILGAKAVAAAPLGLAASVATGASVAGAPVAGVAAGTLSKAWKFAIFPAAALILTVAIGVHLNNRPAQKPSVPPPQQKISAAVQPAPDAALQVAAIPEPARPAAPAVPVTGMKFQALDADSLKPVTGAKLHVAYFRDDGKAKGAELQTSNDGTAQVELPQFPYSAVNLFVSAPGHVPLVVNWQNGNMPTNYVMKLPVGTLAGGTILNESQQPVANATIYFSVMGGNDPTKRENIQYYNSDAPHTDADGHWLSDMMPASVDQIVLRVEHPDYALLATQLVVNVPAATNSSFVVQAGTPVSGIVTDADGNPVPGAKVRRISSRAEAENADTTDATGHFQLRHMLPGDLELSVQADGFGPVAMTTAVTNEPLNLAFKLGPSSIFRGHVFDEKGAPVSNAVVATTSDNYGMRPFVWSTRTDGQGKFEWDSAPADPVQFRAEAPGFLATGMSLKPDGSEHEIRLTHLGAAPVRSVVKITGTVLDQDTGLPLDDFKVLVGDAGNLEMPVRFSFGTDGKNGAFDFRTRQNYAYQIEIQKDGYVPIASTNLFAKDGDQSFTFKLRKDNGLNGVVLLPDGKPAVNVDVYLYELQGGVYMDKPGKVRKGYPVTETQPTQTDDHGKFSFTARLHPCGFICVHDEGYADVPLTNFNGKITLQPWGRVEGKLIVNGKSAAGQDICIQNLPSMHNPSPDRRLFPALQLWLEATTAADGSFIFEKVPPGEHKITQRLARSGPTQGRIYDTQGKPITVVPGAITSVKLGGHGTMISGRAAFSGTTQLPIVWNQVAVELSLKVPSINDSLPKRDDFSSDAAFGAASKSFRDIASAYWESDAGRVFERSLRGYATYCADDGSFQIPDVPGGKYKLKIVIRQLPGGPNDFDGKVVGALETDLVVPDSPGDEHPMMNLGTVQLSAPKPGEVSGL